MMHVYQTIAQWASKWTTKVAIHILEEALFNAFKSCCTVIENMVQYDKGKYMNLFSRKSGKHKLELIAATQKKAKLTKRCMFY